MKSEPMRVVCALIQRSGLVCVTRRSGESRYFPDLWEHPGGKVENGESDAAALMRELEEELGVDVVVEDFIRVERFGPPIFEHHATLVLYRVTLLHGEPKPLVAAELRWVTPGDLWQLDGTPSFHVFNTHLRRTAALLRSA